MASQTFCRLSSLVDTSANTYSNRNAQFNALGTILISKPLTVESDQIQFFWFSPQSVANICPQMMLSQSLTMLVLIGSGLIGISRHESWNVYSIELCQLGHAQFQLGMSKKTTEESSSTPLLQRTFLKPRRNARQTEETWPHSKLTLNSWASWRPFVSPLIGVLNH